MDGRRTGDGDDDRFGRRSIIFQAFFVFAGADRLIGFADLDVGPFTAERIGQEGTGFFGPGMRIFSPPLGGATRPSKSFGTVGPRDDVGRKAVGEEGIRCGAADGGQFGLP